MPVKLFSFLFLGLTLSGCILTARPPTPTAISAATASLAPSSTAELPTATPSTISTNKLPTSTPEVVTVAASKGNLFIRRGPDLAFNPISVLMDGQSATASGRDVLSDWLRIHIPGHPGDTGWVSIQTNYSLVSGDVSSLPEITPTDWPIPAFVRNCTYDQMQADPGGIVLPPVTSFPDNDVRLNPGTYRIYDTDVDGSPEVLKVDLREGSAIDVRDDGNGDHKKCPVP